jgi:hypothetical protein
MRSTILIYTENYIYGPIESNISINVDGHGLIIKWSSNEYPKRELIV